MENRHSGVEHPLCPRNTAVTKTILAPQSLIAKLCGVFFLKVLWLVHQCVGTCQPWVAVVTGYSHQGTGGLGKGLLQAIKGGAGLPDSLGPPSWGRLRAFLGVACGAVGSCVRPWSCHPPALVLSWAPLLFKSHLQVYETQCMVSYCLFENFTRKDGASWGRGGKTGSLLKGTEGIGAVSTIQAASPRISSKPSRESGIKPGLCHLEVPTPWTLLLPVSLAHAALIDGTGSTR